MAFLVVIVWHIYNAHLNRTSSRSTGPSSRVRSASSASGTSTGWMRAAAGAAAGAIAPEPEHPVRRLSWPAQLVVAPAVGGAFAMLLPVIGVGVAAKAAFDRISGRGRYGRGARPATADPPPVRKAG